MFFFPPKKKQNLYIALYLWGGSQDTSPIKHHWALLTSPQNPKPTTLAIRHDAKDHHDPSRPNHRFFYYSREQVTWAPKANLLAYVFVAEIADLERLEEVLGRQRIVQDDVGWTCKAWVREALEGLVANGKCLGKKADIEDWMMVERVCMEYVARKKREGRWSSGGPGRDGDVPTYDLVRLKELVV